MILMYVFAILGALVGYGALLRGRKGPPEVPVESGIVWVIGTVWQYGSLMM